MSGRLWHMMGARVRGGSVYVAGPLLIEQRREVAGLCWACFVSIGFVRSRESSQVAVAFSFVNMVYKLGVVSTGIQLQVSLRALHTCTCCALRCAPCHIYLEQLLFGKLETAVLEQADTTQSSTSSGAAVDSGSLAAQDSAAAASSAVARSAALRLCGGGVLLLSAAALLLLLPL